MNENPYVQKVVKSGKTTGYGVAGEILTAIAVFLPPPFNIAVMGVGMIVKGVAWYFAQDRTEKEPEV